jgi:hypothetical protein
MQSAMEADANIDPNSTHVIYMYKKIRTVAIGSGQWESSKKFPLLLPFFFIPHRFSGYQ